MPEYLIMMRVKKEYMNRHPQKWQRANDFETLHHSEAIAELEMLREEFPEWEFRLATLKPE